MQSLDLMYADVNDDPDAHVSVVNQLDGSRLSGDEAPTQRDLSAWLDEHPDYVVEKQLLHSEVGVVFARLSIYGSRHLLASF